jgi:hypothetical protein
MSPMLLSPFFPSRRPGPLCYSVSMEFNKEGI